MNMRMLLSLSLIVFSSASVAATTVDLRVTGTIVPAACDITLAGGDFDFGSINSGSLNSTSGTTLASPGSKSINVVCSAPTLVGIRAIDNRAGTATNSTDDAYGVGQDARGAKIGYYLIEINADAVVDGSAAFKSWSNDAGVSWGAPSRTVLPHTPGVVVSWNRTSPDADPDSVTLVAQPISVQLHIAPTNTLDTSSEVAIDGSATIELVYF